jgi:hypothetical protein
LAKTIESHRFGHDLRESWWKFCGDVGKMKQGVKGFPYGLSVESFLPKRLANRTIPGDRSLGLKRTLRRCS